MAYKTYKRSYRKYSKTPNRYGKTPIYSRNIRGRWLLKRKFTDEIKKLSSEDIKLLKNIKNAKKEDWAYLVGILSGIGLIGFVLLKPGGEFWLDIVLELIE